MLTWTIDFRRISLFTCRRTNWKSRHSDEGNMRLQRQGRCLPVAFRALLEITAVTYRKRPVLFSKEKNRDQYSIMSLSASLARGQMLCSELVDGGRDENN